MPALPQEYGHGVFLPGITHMQTHRHRHRLCGSISDRLKSAITHENQLSYEEYTALPVKPLEIMSSVFLGLDPQKVTISLGSTNWNQFILVLNRRSHKYMI